MRSAYLQQPARSATAARASSAADAEAAQIDARLELAAKKAALASLEAQAGPPAAEAPVAAPAGRVVIQSGDKVLTYENPTAEQLAQIGVGQRQPELTGWQIVAVSSVTVWGIFAGLALVLWHRRRVRSMAVPGATADAGAAARMSRIENAIESIAVEVERISEGQRFASKMLAEGVAVPVAVGDRGDAVPQNRREN